MRKYAITGYTLTGGSNTVRVGVISELATYPAPGLRGVTEKRVQYVGVAAFAAEGGADPYAELLNQYGGKAVDLGRMAVPVSHRKAVETFIPATAHHSRMIGNRSFLGLIQAYRANVGGRA